jgi:hypothetical protein
VRGLLSRSRNMQCLCHQLHGEHPSLNRLDKGNRVWPSPPRPPIVAVNNPIDCGAYRAYASRERISIQRTIPLEPAAEGIVAEAASKMTTDPMAAVAMRRYHTSGHGRLQKATAAARPRMFLRIHLFFCDGRCRISWSPHYRELSLPRAVISDRLTASKLNPCLSRLSTACPREQ